MSLRLKRWTSGQSISFVGGSASPFIDKGDGITSERERVRVLLSLFAHAGGYKMMVGAHNTVDVTVECQVHMGGCVGFFGKGGCRYLQNTVGVCEEHYHVYLVW